MTPPLDLARLSELAERHVEAPWPPLRGQPRNGRQCAACNRTWPCDARVLLDALRDERAKTADVLGARDILRDWLDGNDNGYPLPNGDWERDVVQRARAATEPTEREAAP